MKFLDQIKSLNPRTPGEWPLSVKWLSFGLLFCVTLAAGYLFDWSDQWLALDAARQQEATLKETFLSKKRQAINLNQAKKQLAETEQSFGALLRQLPSKSEMDALLTDVNQAGLARGLQFDLFRPGAETVNGVFAEQPIAIKVSGGYDDLGHFASDIAQLSRIVTLSEISLNPAGNHLLMETTAKTYRYLDAAELAAQKAAGAKK